ncbi:unnamed protein product [Sphagnum jensenii]|uniref:Uncharacterized protein n=1 Tax=Sphagnum jensenii TaxID=128206 RepID=A0ABP1ANQ9_9BRYO
MAKGAGAKQSTKGSSCGSGAASQGELQQQGPDDGGAAAGALLGYASKIHCQNIIFSYEMAFGGAGYAISHPFAKELAKIQDSCIQRYPHFFGGDDHTYACVAELGFLLQKNPVFIMYYQNPKTFFPIPDIGRFFQNFLLCLG